MQPAKEKAGDNGNETNDYNCPLSFIHITPMRDRVWNNLANIKFKALYTSECCRVADGYSRLYSFFLAFASASSIATWAIWKEVPAVWATIVAVGQLLHISKPYIPFIKNDKAFLEMSFEYESLYLEYEKLWYALERQTIDESTAEQRFYEFRQKEIDIEKSHKDVRCPNHKRRMKKIDEATDRCLERNFSQTAYLTKGA